MAEVNFIVETLTSVGLILFVTLQSIVKALIPVKYQQKKDISKDTVLITGSGSGIGRALAIRLAKMGCRLVLWDINEEGNNETAAEIKKFGGQAHPYTVDLSKREDVYKMADQVLTEVGGVDILVNNAGLAAATPDVLVEIKEEFLEKMLYINLFSHFWTTRAFLPAMLEKDYGHIVEMASVASLVGAPKAIPYGATKYGVLGFAESLNLELRITRKSIETTVVCPYFTNTPFLQGNAVVPRFPSLLPLLEPDYVVSKTIQAIQTNQKILYIPKLLYFIMVLKALLPNKAHVLFMVYIHFWSSIKMKMNSAKKS